MKDIVYPGTRAEFVNIFVVLLLNRSMYRTEEEWRLINEEIADLRAENEKLRDVEEQFWIVLNEREDLMRQLGQSAEASRGAPDATDTAAIDSMSDRMRAEYDAMANALRESMELLMAKELRQSLEASAGRGVVATFLRWLEMDHDRAVTIDSISKLKDGIGVNDSRGRSVTLPGLDSGERDMLLKELNAARQEVKILQEELDRTDMSRLQALQDAERMQKQIEILSGGVAELRSAYNALKSQGESSSRNGQIIQAQRAQLAEKDAVIHDLKAKISRLERLHDSGSADLLADAARIRQELVRRSSSQDIVLSPS